MKATSFIDELLAEQQQLTAVERFAQRQTQARNDGLPIYRELIPLERPKPGEQYAFRVDLDLCTGCKACVSACHSLNGLDEDETWRSVGLLHGGSAEEPYQQTVTTACHHCVDPACLNGCPVLAYEKDEETGIVRHLDDQCIGCQYCVLKCPYDVPKYSPRRGIVRKCDMCHGRLAMGEAPACAQACPSAAISIQIVSKERVTLVTAKPDSRLLPGAFPSEYTKPTTHYVSRRPFPEICQAANGPRLQLEPAHWPLVWMLVLTQTAAGLFLGESIRTLWGGGILGTGTAAISICALVSLLAGLGASVVHLGKPLGAWRALLGLRRSWMSREILAFSLFAGASVAVTGAAMINAGSALFWMHTAAALGMISVFCSAMIYVDTRRPSWAGKVTFRKFFGTTFLLGSAGSAAILNWVTASGSDGAFRNEIMAAVWTATGFRAALFVWELRDFLIGDSDENSTGFAARRLMKNFFWSQIALFVISTSFGLLALFGQGWLAASLATMSFLTTFSSRVVERYCFFVTSRAPKMPGSVSP